MSKLATSELSIFELVSVAVEASLSLTLLEIPKTGFLAARPNYKLGYLRSVGMTSSCFKMTRLPYYITIFGIHCVHTGLIRFFSDPRSVVDIVLFIYSPTSMDYSWG